ncbi:MAG TPA: hypothetical protein VKX17_12570 [Planctomycetota bacterium]|nr:hypothetical protein [Planctomycetota bacterium]
MHKETRAIVGLMLALSLWASARSAEKLTLHMAGGQTLRCEVVKITKSDVQVKTDGGKDQTLPLQLIDAQDVVLCYKQAIEPFNAELRFEMGAFFAKKELYGEAKEELNAAARLDDSYKARADELLKKFPGATPEKTADAKTSDKQPGDKKVASTDKPPDKSNPKTPGDKAGDSEYSNELMTLEDFRKKFLRKDIPPRSEAQMKEFLAKRLGELDAKVGGKWRMVETKHFYCFANIPEAKQDYIAKNWNEALYDLLCRVLSHKDGEKLWNNKMPIYYFSAFKQFQKFAAEIDKSPGAGYSGGYFSAEGREVHICIPFMSERYKSEADKEKMDYMARATLAHEGTHAFLQLSGEDVYLSRSLHEGMAQFIEFWYEDPKFSDKKERLGYLRDYIAQHRSPPDWDEFKERPRSGGDIYGYCSAYAKIEYLYRRFDSQCLPKMIKQIKSGKPEKDAMEAVFGHPLMQLEDDYVQWLKGALKTNFDFPKTAR